MMMLNQENNNYKKQRANTRNWRVMVVAMTTITTNFVFVPLLLPALPFVGISGSDAVIFIDHIFKDPISSVGL